ncbi:hypothetical protein ABT009_34140 [Streptomyces sp. NPDC002896]|uniref:MmyB family transcriptional regulator n=1 Tax=Streptomyces sp. NPDC002896 TaxID=3154438 RepID=UPI00332ADD0A
MNSPYDYEVLAVTGDPDQTLGIYTAEPGSPSEQALRLLAGWTSEPAAPPPHPQPSPPR